MLLTNGACYKNNEGVLIRVQKGEKGGFTAFNADGEGVAKYADDEHVSGWEPIGSSEFFASKTQVEKDGSKPGEVPEEETGRAAKKKKKNKGKETTESDDDTHDPA